MRGEKGNNIDRFKELMTQRMNSAVPMTLRRVIVDKVDWENRTMECTDLIDDLPHYDVRLGMGSMALRPVVGSLCIIALIGKEEVDTTLFAADAIDQIEVIDSTGFKLDLNQGKMTINGDAFSGIVKAPELKKQIDKNTALLKAIQDAFKNWKPSPNDGGTALKVLTVALAGLQRADLGNIENENIKHG